MSLFDSYLLTQIVTAEPECMLSELSSTDIELNDVCFLDSLTFEVKIRRNQLPAMERLLNKYSAKFIVIKRNGMLWWIKSLLKRPILVVGMVLFFVLTYISPHRIFFVKILGNEKVPKNLIISQAKECGIQFGAKASEIRSEETKNRLLGSIPDLQWVGITTSGSTAIMRVTERSIKDEVLKQQNVVSCIVAARDGVISKMTIRKGMPLFSVGQSVKKGDVIVSGYTDCGIKIVAEMADAEVFAHTLHKNRIITPSVSSVRESLYKCETCYRLRIGKKVIKLCNHSGISDATCVKMYSENYLTLPGGFQLPVSVVKVEKYSFEQVCWDDDNDASSQWLPQFARNYLRDQMIAGTILEEKLQWEMLDGACVLTGIYTCNEMIGQVKFEEIIKQNAEDN